MDKDTPIFKDKTLSNILEDIYQSSKAKDERISTLIDIMSAKVSSPQDVIMIMPIVKEYMDVAVKNDEHVIKMAMIIQRMVSGVIKSDLNNEYVLSDLEKESLLQEVKKLETEVKINCLPSASTELLTTIDRQIEESLKESDLETETNGVSE